MRAGQAAGRASGRCWGPRWSRAAKRQPRSSQRQALPAERAAHADASVSPFGAGANGAPEEPKGGLPGAGRRRQGGPAAGSRATPGEQNELLPRAGSNSLHWDGASQ